MQCTLDIKYKVQKWEFPLLLQKKNHYNVYLGGQSWK